ncbi:MAG: prolyl oligopeptidase family protein [Phycisphaerae bacterium]
MVLRILAGVVLGLAWAASADGPPVARKQQVTDTFHGVSVSEDYRWLEDWEDPAVKEWSEKQNVYARRVLDHLPNVKAIGGRVTEILSAKTVGYGSVTQQGGTVFAVKRQPPKQQPFLVVMSSADDPSAERVLVDPNELDPSGTTTMDWYVPSPDGRLVAVSLSKGGTESGDVHVYDVVAGKQVHEVIPGVNGGTAGGDLSWAPNGSGFFYTRYPRGNERPPEDMPFYLQTYYHALGTPTESDRYEMGKDLPRIAEIQLDVDLASGRQLASVQDGDGGEFSHYLRSTGGKWRQFSTFGDKTLQATFGPHDDLYVLSRKNAPRGKILRINVETLDVGQAQVIVPQGKDVIVDNFMGPSSVVVTDTRIYVQYQLGGPSEIRVFGLDGSPKEKPKQLPVSSIGGMAKLDGDDILFSNNSFIEPTAWYRYSPKSGKTVKTGLASTTPVDLSDARVVREFATSKDGTKVPVNIILPPGVKLDGSNPCVVNGYGGYGVNISPRFRATTKLLLEQGVIYAVANIRGGGEYGEEWHRQGNLTHKQNVFDDFAAAVKHMIERGYTSSERLAIIGGSNGGLLMGATLVQNPKLVKAVVSYVGIYDMLRVELSPNGAFNIPEFGTVEKPDQFKALYAYSPYHNVRDGVAYPATLFLTGANDPRVDPMQSRKMTARLQAAASKPGSILLRTSSDSGHGGGTALKERIAQTVDVYAFLFDQLGVDFHTKAGRKILD